jgi:hypothetical protein
MKASIALSDEVRATLDEDGSLLLLKHTNGQWSTLALSPTEALRLGFLLAGQAASELRQRSEDLAERRDNVPDLAVG